MTGTIRRTLIALTTALLPVPTAVLYAGDAPAFAVKLDTISSGFDKKTCWVHPRAGAISGNPPSVVLTMQKLLLTGSDVFYALNEMRAELAEIRERQYPYPRKGVRLLQPGPGILRPP